MSKKVDKEKVIAYRRSKLFPWNFIFEDVDERAIAYFTPYALQMLGEQHEEREREIERGKRRIVERTRRNAWTDVERRGAQEASARTDKEKLRMRIRDEVSAVVSDFLSETDDDDAIKMHGEFASVFPFAFSQCLVQAMLSRMNMRIEDVIDVNAISELMGIDVDEIRKREDLIREIISKKRNLKMPGRNLLGKKVMSESGEHVGDVSDIIFDAESGVMRCLRVMRRRGSGREQLEEMKLRKRKEMEIPMRDLRFNSYNGGFVLREA